MKSIIVIALWFGPWPPWLRLFLLSCGLNPTISWLIISDQKPLVDTPDNVSIRITSWKAFRCLVSHRLNIDYKPHTPYSVCNLRPFFGVLFNEEITGFDFFGWCDLDVVWGDIRSFYDEGVLSADLISPDAAITSGHFLLLRNQSFMIDAYTHIEGWVEKLESRLENDWSDSLDEFWFSTIFSPDPWLRGFISKKVNLDRYRSKALFKQRFSTPFVPQKWHDGSYYHPEIWFWRDGKVSNLTDGSRSFLYLHLMNFKSPRWINHNLYGEAKTWDMLGKAARFSFNEAASNYVICRQGIWPL